MDATRNAAGEEYQPVEIVEVDDLVPRKYEPARKLPSEERMDRRDNSPQALPAPTGQWSAIRDFVENPPDTTPTPRIASLALAFHFPISAKSEKERNRLLAAIDGLNGEWAEHKRQSEAIRSVDAADFTGEHLTIADRLRRPRFELLKREIELREAVNQFLETIEVDARAVHNAYIAAREKACETARAGLLSIGFTDDVLQQNGLVEYHPTVSKLRLDIASVHGWSPTDLGKANRAGLERAEREVETARAKALAGI